MPVNNVMNDRLSSHPTRGCTAPSVTMRGSLQVALALIYFISAVRTQRIEFPSKITLRVGVLQAAPFAVKDVYGVYTGYQPDLLNKMIGYAQLDGCELVIDYSKADQIPTSYDDALTLVANDCAGSQCGEYDMIVGDYYGNPDRALRARFTPAWVITRISAMKVLVVGEYDSLAVLNDDGGTVCALGGTVIPELVGNQYPNMKVVECPTEDDCIANLRDKTCGLYADDELLLRFMATEDDTLAVISEGFGTQYIVWPIRFGFSADIYAVISKWIYQAVEDNTLDRLAVKYFGSLKPALPPPVESTSGSALVRLSRMALVLAGATTVAWLG